MAEMKTFQCKDIYPDCDWKYEGKDESDVLQHAAEHGREKHGIMKLSPELIDKVRGKIRDVKAA